MPFDVRGARAAGYSDAEIMAFMQQPRPVAPPPPAPTMQDLSGQLDPSAAYPGWVQTGMRKLRDLMSPSNVMGGPVIDPEEFVPTPTSVALDLAGAALPPGVKLISKGVKALKSAKPVADLPEFVYHGTSSETLRKIQEGALMPSTAGKTIHLSGERPEAIGGVYLTRSPISAGTFAHSAVEKTGGSPVVLRIPTGQLKALQHDPEMSGLGFIHRDPIPATSIERIFDFDNPVDVTAIEADILASRRK